MGVEGGQGVEEGPTPAFQRAEVRLVGSFDVGQGNAQQSTAGVGETHLPGAAVIAIDPALEESTIFELASYLTGHHRVDSGLRSQLCLGRMLAFVVFEPPKRGQEDELHVSELVWRQHRAHLSLPGERDAPEQEAWAVVWRTMQRARAGIAYADRSLANAINDAIVAGKSAVIIGPSARA